MFFGYMHFSYFKPTEPMLNTQNIPRKSVSIFTTFSLKGQCHEIFECWFFHQKAPPGPLRGTPGRFHFCIEKKIGSAVYDKP